MKKKINEKEKEKNCAGDLRNIFRERKKLLQKNISNGRRAIRVGGK